MRLPLLLFVALTASCSSVDIPNPVGAAKSLEQKSFALYGLFVVAEEHAVKIVLSPRVPEQVKKSIKAADKYAKPAADALASTALAVVRVRDDLEDGKASEQDLVTAIGFLGKVLQDAEPLIHALIDAVGRGEQKI